MLSLAAAAIAAVIPTPCSETCEIWAENPPLHLAGHVILPLTSTLLVVKISQVYRRPSEPISDCDDSSCRRCRHVRVALLEQGHASLQSGCPCNCRQAQKGIPAKDNQIPAENLVLATDFPSWKSLPTRLNSKMPMTLLQIGFGLKESTGHGVRT